jgi:PAS domain S-box-containing protein
LLGVGSALADPGEHRSAPALWVDRSEFLWLLAAHPSPLEIGRRVWRESEPWLAAIQDLAAGPEVLLAELAEWASLLDRHSTLDVRATPEGTAVDWQNAPGLDPDPRECELRLGALVGLLAPGSTGPERGESVVHRSCAARGDSGCVFLVRGLAPRADPAHVRVLLEAMLLAGALQGREELFRRLARISGRKGPFPGARDLRAVRRFIEELEDPVMIFDRALWMIDANQATVRLSGLSLDELRGVSARDLLTPDSFRRLLEAIPSVLEQGALRSLVIDARTRTGWARLEVSARFSEDRRILVCVARDVSERVRLEGELEERTRRLQEQNVRIAEADRLKTEFLANVSHELTTPLTCIKGFAKLLVEDLAGEAEGREGRLGGERRVEFLRIVQRETERMGALIRGLLELSKIESGVVSLDRASASLNSIVREALLLLKPRLDERELLVDLHLDPELPLAPLDSDRMKQVVLNLVENAIKFGEAGSAIVIRTAVHGSALRLSVRNSSRDLTAADLSRIFERFVQRDGSFARQHGGVGLGLNLVRAIVELHRGRIWAELPEPSTVEFIAELPLATK